MDGNSTLTAADESVVKFAGALLSWRKTYIGRVVRRTGELFSCRFSTAEDKNSWERRSVRSNICGIDNRLSQHTAGYSWYGQPSASFRCPYAVVFSRFASYTLRRLSELYCKFGKLLYVCSADIQKAFDSVWRAGPWHARRYLGCDDKIINIMKRLTMNVVRVDGGFSDWFSAVVELLQGWALSPLLTAGGGRY